MNNRLLINTIIDVCDRSLTRSFEKTTLMSMKNIFEIANEGRIIDMAIDGADIIGQVKQNMVFVLNMFLRREIESPHS